MRRKPLIGITCHYLPDPDRFTLRKEYCNGILEAGGLPLLLCCYGQDDIQDIASGLDGLLLSGGGDIDPRFFGEEPIPGLGEVNLERDEFEIQLIKTFVKMHKPIFGICRGIQIINVAMGGSLYQDLDSQWGKERIQHNQKGPGNQSSHRVILEPGTVLEKIMGNKREIWVNSFHHESIRTVAPALKVNAYAPDGVIEGIEGKQEIQIMGVQWHPERMLQANEDMLQLFRFFVDSCRR